MPAAILRRNAERTAFELVSPEGEEFDATECADFEVMEGNGGNYLVVLDPGEDSELEPDSVYRLVKVPVQVVEADLEIEGSVDDDFEDDDDDDETPAV